MQLGIFAKTFIRPTLEGALDRVAAHGLRCAQWNFSCAGLPNLPEEIDPEVLDRIGRAADSRKISLAAISGTFNMIHPDPRRRQEGLRGLGVLAGACRKLGIPVITLCTGTRDPDDMWRHHPDNDSSQAWKDLTSTLSQALAIAEQFGVTLGIEPEVSNVVSSAQKGRRLLDEMQSAHLKVIMDGANLFAAGQLARMREVLDEAFELLGPEIVMAHAKDLDRDGEAGQRAAGTGLLDYEHYLELLRQAGFKGPLMLHGLAETEVDGCVKFLRQQLSKTAS